MKKIFTGFLLLAIPIFGLCQQEAHYTQFMYNKLAINPAYAGSYDNPCFTAVHRSQWLGLEGAPTTQQLSFDSPLAGRRVGLGLNIIRNTIGVSEKWTVGGNYAYQVPLGKGKLGVGIQASLRYLGTDYTDPRLRATQEISSDGGIPSNSEQRYSPNFGAGIYYSTSQFYLGISAPRLLENDIDFNSLDGTLGREIRHYYGMLGMLFQIGKRTQLQPQILVKYLANAPIDADVNFNFIFSQKYTVGASYRLGGEDDIGESLDFLLAMQLNTQLLFGLSYDLTFSKIKDYSNGSVEAILRYCLAKKEDRDKINPRFF